MRVHNLASGDLGTTIDTDLAIVGGGPAGLTIARELFGTSIQVLVIESGQLEEESRFDSLNTVENIGQPSSAAQVRRRIAFHGANSPSWRQETQGFGVRCRVLGGSSHAWAGKSAAFDEIDFSPRAWVPYSGWPFGLETLGKYLDRAANVLNLGPNCYDEKLWKLIGSDPPQPPFDRDLLRSFFWQFSRSRIDPLDIMRFGPEFLTLDAANVRVLLNATVCGIDTNEQGSAVAALQVSTVDGARSWVRAKAFVLAASAIENARLLLISNGVHRNGLGNQNDAVGRFLMDHVGARIGHFDARNCRAIVRRFGFYGLRNGGRTYMYMHGLIPSEERQKRERLLNCAVYMMEERAPDDPWDALKRLLQAKSEKPFSDLFAIVSSPGLLAKGASMRLFETNVIPRALKQSVADAIIKAFPNFAVREFQNRGLPHKLTGVAIDGICEHRPNPESRITLSDKVDALGVPIAKVDWRDDMEARRSLVRVGRLLESEFPRVGLPAPVLENWIVQNNPQDAVVIDTGHTAGTTRMSDDPKMGVVDSHCKVHGVAGLYVAGGSVFPTSGHANPTLMIVALAIRLADQIKLDLAH